LKEAENEIKELDQEVERLEKQMNLKFDGKSGDSSELRVQFEREKRNYEIQISNLNAIIAQKDSELEQLYELTNQRKQENAELRK